MLDSQIILDGMGQGVLIFDAKDQLVLSNTAAQKLLGADFKVIRENGWSAASVMLNAGLKPEDSTADIVRQRVQEDGIPVRFHVYRSGEHIPCWLSLIRAADNTPFLLLTLDSPDWSAFEELMSRFKGEIKEAIDSTRGHIDIINKSIKQMKPTDTVEQLNRRISGFHRLVGLHMHRTTRFMAMLERLENIRTGYLRQDVRDHSRKIVLGDFLEDFLEELDENKLLDPETEGEDHRSRIHLTVADGLEVRASVLHLSGILQDVLRNAIMYSMKASTITITVKSGAQKNTVQVDVRDEGYGIRSREFERVFAMFQRGRQPQVISEFGYGLSLYLCKHEAEAMQGRMWFESEEGAGSTFSLLLPAWRDTAQSTTQQAQVVAGGSDFSGTSSSSAHNPA